MVRGLYPATGRAPAFYLCLALATLCGIGAVITEFFYVYGRLNLACWIGFWVLLFVSGAFLESDPAQEPN